MAEDSRVAGLAQSEQTPLLLAHASPSRDHSLQRYDDSDESDDEYDGAAAAGKVVA
jgi:hypothetical protein